MTTESDRATIIGCCRGERAAMENLVRLYSNLVYSAVHRTCREKCVHCSDQDLEDLHNTVFLRLLEKRCRRLRQFKGKNGCSLASWIRVVTVRTVLDHLRRTRDALSRVSMRDSTETLAHFKADLPEPWQLLDQFEQHEILQRAMMSLAPRDRLFIKLHFMEGSSQGDIAEIMNISRNTVYSLKHRAIERLKEIIEKEKEKN